MKDISAINFGEKSFFNSARLMLRKFGGKVAKWIRRHINSIRFSIVVVFSLVAVWSLYLDYKFLDNTEWIFFNSGFGEFLGQSLISVGPELAGIVIGVTVIDILNEWRQNDQLKAQLIRQMGSRYPDVAVTAAKEMRYHGWGFGEDSSLEGAFLEGANLREAFLAEVNLRQAFLDRSSLSWSYLESANLDETWLSKANLEKADFRKANLRLATLWEANLKECNLMEADLSGAHLSAANLQGANMIGANLRFSDLRGANLGGADLMGTILLGADMMGTNIQGAKHITPQQLIEATTLKDTIMPDGSSSTKWALELYKDGKISEKTFNYFIRLSNGEGDEEE
jgi:hypothetical protein